MKRRAVYFPYLAKLLRDKSSRNFAMKKNLWQITCLMFRLNFPHIIMPYFIFIVEIPHTKEALGREALRLLLTAVGHSSKKTQVVGMALECLFIY